MLQRFTSRLPAIAMAGLLILGMSERAHANLSVTLIETSPANPAGTLQLGNNSQFSGTVMSGTSQASFTATGQDFPSAGAAPARMDLSSFSITTSGPATVSLIFSMNNISTPVGPGIISESITGQFVAGTGGISYTTFGSNANTLFTTVPTAGQFQGSAGPVTSLSPPNNSATGAYTATSLYSLTEVLTINFTSAGLVELSSDSSANFTVVPEPTSMAMAGLGALGFIAYGLRRRKASGA